MTQIPLAIFDGANSKGSDQFFHGGHKSYGRGQDRCSVVHGRGTRMPNRKRDVMYAAFAMRIYMLHTRHEIAPSHHGH